MCFGIPESELDEFVKDNIEIAERRNKEIALGKIKLWTQEDEERYRHGREMHMRNKNWRN